MEVIELSRFSEPYRTIVVEPRREPAAPAREPRRPQRRPEPEAVRKPAKAPAKR
jgi:hypothetical protein